MPAALQRGTRISASAHCTQLGMCYAGLCRHPPGCQNSLNGPRPGPAPPVIHATHCWDGLANGPRVDQGDYGQVCQARRLQSLRSRCAVARRLHTNVHEGMEGPS